MHRAGWATMVAMMLGAATGCGSPNGSASAPASGDPPPEQQASADGVRTDPTDEGAPSETAAANNIVDDATEQKTAAEAVSKFLKMVRNGDPAAGDMLTELAREKTDEEGIQFAPSGSETASFEVSEVELLREGPELGAHVGSTWTDMDDEGKPHTDEIIWALRREPEGWRVAGMVTKPFEDMAPVVLDFEDPKDMKRQQQLVDQEVQRRMRAESSPSADKAPDGTTSREARQTNRGSKPIKKQ